MIPRKNSEFFIFLDSIARLIFVVETQFVFCKVETEIFLIAPIILMNYVL
jgi:hypothetical protein